MKPEGGSGREGEGFVSTGKGEGAGERKTSSEVVVERSPRLAVVTVVRAGVL